jgi:hypothetical protein
LCRVTFWARAVTPPSDLLNIAIVGINGMGAVNAQAVMSQNIVAICDVDDRLVDARIDAWRKSLAPPPPSPPRPRARDRRLRRPPSLPSRCGVPRAFRLRPMHVANESANTGLRRFIETQLPRVKRHRDYREMFAIQKDIDAVIIAHAGSHARADRLGGDGCR